jgi:hypothetical protein
VSPQELLRACKRFRDGERAPESALARVERALRALQFAGYRNAASRQPSLRAGAQAAALELAPPGAAAEAKGELLLAFSRVVHAPVFLGLPHNRWDGVPAAQQTATFRLLATFHAATWGLRSSAAELDGVSATGGICRIWADSPKKRNGRSLNGRTWGWRQDLIRIDRAADAASAWLDAREPQALLHGDASHRNIPTLGNAPERLFMYNFECAGRGPPARDLAYLLGWSRLQFMSIERYNLKSEEALLGTYIEAFEAGLKLRGAEAGGVPPRRAGLSCVASSTRDGARCRTSRRVHVKARAQALLAALDSGKYTLANSSAYGVALTRQASTYYQASHTPSLALNKGQSAVRFCHDLNRCLPLSSLRTAPLSPKGPRG